MSDPVILFDCPVFFSKILINCSFLYLIFFCFSVSLFTPFLSLCFFFDWLCMSSFFSFISLYLILFFFLSFSLFLSFLLVLSLLSLYLCFFLFRLIFFYLSCLSVCLSFSFSLSFVDWPYLSVYLFFSCPPTHFLSLSTKSL